MDGITIETKAMTPAETYRRYEEIRDRLEAGGLSYDERKDLDKQWHEAILGIIPEVGRGCTICYWSDKRAATITKVEYTKDGKPKAVVVTHNKVICKDWFADEYEILPELQDGWTDRFTLRRNGRWYMDGQETSPNSVVLMLHYQAHSIDPSF
jgi:hypothetical protein